MTIINKSISVLLILLMYISMYSCNNILEYENDNLNSSITNGDETWAIYWYLCGSDLESDGGFASDDMEEMLAVSLPSNVNVIIQTGGAYEWQNDIVSSDYTQRYIYNQDGLYAIDSMPIQNMGDSKTLEEFLYFCTKNYPADRQAVIFWNHGGGSVSDIAFDELFNYDSLTLNELYDAFSNVMQGSQKPIFDLIGLDACLMSTIDTAYTLKDFGKYMVASQELEPGIGWDYERIFNIFENDIYI